MTTLHTPMYLLRRRMVLDLVGERPVRFLEIGCGRGNLLVQLARRGFRGVGIEISAAARASATAAAAAYPDRLTVEDLLEAVADQTFELVMAFEVLEHVDDDRSTLQSWVDRVAPGGRFLLSVPAHMRKWTLADDYGGHLRRYERPQLEQLLAGAGLTIETLWTYGFPVSSLTRGARRLAYRRRIGDVAGKSRLDRTLASSFDSTRAGRGSRIVAAATETIGHVGSWMQRWFRETELGEGFLVGCRRAG